jgi:hypothetical protein
MHEVLLGLSTVICRDAGIENCTAVAQFRACAIEDRIVPTKKMHRLKKRRMTEAGS